MKTLYQELIEDMSKFNDVFINLMSKLSFANSVNTKILNGPLEAMEC